MPRQIRPTRRLLQCRSRPYHSNTSSSQLLRCLNPFDDFVLKQFFSAGHVPNSLCGARWWRGRASDYQSRGRWFNPTRRRFETSNLVHLTVPVSFERDTESRWSLQSGVYVMGKRSHTGVKWVTCSGLTHYEL